MREETCNIFSLEILRSAGAVCVPTNLNMRKERPGFVDSPVLTIGFAGQATQRWGNFSTNYAVKLRRFLQRPEERQDFIYGARMGTFYCEGERKELISFPARKNFWDPPDEEMILRSAQGVASLVHAGVVNNIYLPKPVSKGYKNWAALKVELSRILNDQITLCTLPSV